MSFLNKMQRRFGRHSIAHLTQYIIITYVIGYLLYYLAPQALVWLNLEPYLIVHEFQIWRLFTWVLVPPGSPDIFTIIMLFFYYSIGTTLERTWGDFLYNVYIFFGMFMTVVGAFILFLVEQGLRMGISGLGFTFSTYYISLSIFLGFALTYPDMQVLLYFIIPLKMKWLALVDVVYLAINLVQGNWATRVVILCSLANVLVFFFMSRDLNRFRPKEVHRRKTYARAVHESQAKPGQARHKCAVCGRTELDDPTLEFRFCSKCSGNYEYCQDHLFTHEHVK